MTWVIMPVLDNCAESLQAISDVLTQDVPTTLLVVDQGSSDETRDALRRLAGAERRVLLWLHDPCLPSLSATWNRALDFVWQQDEDAALVVNNDLRLHPSTVRVLVRTLVHDHALFVSATGVGEEGWQVANSDWANRVMNEHNLAQRGGPDFSCFLISRACHEKYRFDENYAPAYCEDIDLHRQILLAGEGHRIYALNFPFLHVGSGTLRSLAPEKREALHRRLAGTRRYFASQWGGDCNHETYLRKGDPTSAVEDGTATTPWLQYHREDRHEPA